MGGEIRQEKRKKKEKEGVRGSEEEGKFDVVINIVVLVLGRRPKGQKGEKVKNAEEEASEGIAISGDKEIEQEME